MHNFPQQRKGLAEILGSALCSAAEYLSGEKIGGIKAGTVLFFTVLIAAVIAYHYLYPTPNLFYFIIFGGIIGQIALFLVCKREGLGDYLLEIGLTYAGLAVGWWLTITFDDSLSSAFPMIIGPFVGDGVYALYRKWYRKT